MTHPSSYVHAIIKFKNGLTKILAHDPDMKVPIYNSINLKNHKILKTNSLNLNILNDLKIKKVDKNKFQLIKILKRLPKTSTLFETVLISVNDFLVLKFLDNKINFQKLINLINKFSNLKEFKKYKKIKPKNIDDIYRFRNYVSSKMNSFSI